MPINFNKNPNSYPFVLIPKNIINNFDKKLSVIEACEQLDITYPEKPKPHILSHPTRPLPYSFEKVKKSKIEFNGNLGGCFVVLAIPFCLLLIIVFFLTIRSSPFGSVCLAVFIFLIISQMGIKENIKTTYIEIQKDENTYQLELSKFYSKRAEWESKQREKEKQYEIEKKTVDNIILQKYTEVSNVVFYKQLQSKVEIRKLNFNDNRGKSEIFFLTKLFSKFKNQINVDVVPKVGMNPFQPDFVIICNETGFHIDIEIDEPYSVNNGVPIHHDRSNDENRNSFFEEINWGVIRFTEKQVIQNSYGCCKLIEDILYSIKTRQLKNIIHSIDVEDKWTYEEALIMSNNKYRNTYLPSDMKVNINYKT